MRVVLDEDRCDGHGVCVTVCPDVFGFDDDSDVVRVRVPEPDPSNRAGVEQAVEGCPKGALTVVN